jgi:F420H(2)-dependent quinone reductase
MEQDAPVPVEQPRSPNVPRWLVRSIWIGHRRLYALTGGRLGLRPVTESQWGMLRITTTGRRTGKRRTAILGYIEDGPNLITPAMNGWAEAEPAWWLNLQDHPRATVKLPDGTSREVTARAATSGERQVLWARLVGLGTAAYTDAAAARRSRETAIAVLEPVN